MRWLGLLVMLVSAEAAAIPTCEPVGSSVVPAPNAFVPANAKIWVSGNAPWSYSFDNGHTRVNIEPAAYSAMHAPVVVLQPKLAVDNIHVLRDSNGTVLTVFTVKRADDRKAPEPPTINTGAWGADSLSFVVDADTAMLRIEHVDPHPPRTHVVMLAGNRTCETGPVASSSTCIRATAFDLAGNGSRTVEHCPSAQVIPVTLVNAPSESSGPPATIVIGFIVTLLVGIFLVFAPEIDMGWLRRRPTGDELSTVAARQVARIACHDALARSFGFAAGGTGAVVFASPVIASFMGLGVLLVLSRQIWVYGRARRMLHLLDGEPTVTLHGDHVLRVRSRGEASWLVCSQRQLAHATERVLPQARIV